MRCSAIFGDVHRELLMISFVTSMDSDAIQAKKQTSIFLLKFLMYFDLSCFSISFKDEATL
jgi:hypothetical protein